MTPQHVVLLVLCLSLAACSTAYEWQEFRSGPTTQADVYDAIDTLARADGFGPSTESDRGLAVWVSRWRVQQLGLGRPGRLRLRAEILLDESSAETGFTIRYYFERQKVKELKHAQNPQEDDWSDDGQDQEREFLFGEKLKRRLPAVKVDSESEPDKSLPTYRSGR